jgi:hypothetical protein
MRPLAPDPRKNTLTIARRARFAVDDPTNLATRAPASTADRRGRTVA